MIIVNGHKIDVAEYAPAGSRRLAENAVRSGRDPGCGGRGEDAGTVHASCLQTQARRMNRPCVFPPPISVVCMMMRAGRFLF
ncbi:MAG TPA: hypothetical protein DDZ65_08360 [Firmicutes bacterium]|nr:hypothetical protein [Bacillota bacterium]